MATFELEIATPDRLLVKEKVTEAQVPARGGYLGLLPDHAPLISELGAGTLTYNVGGEARELVVSGGWVEVQPLHTRVLASVAERPSEIDVKRAQEALDRAEKRLRDAGDWDIARAMRAAERARARLGAASKSGR
jgi:F-type H+-transporting ATPase subunit epsilon